MGSSGEFTLCMASMAAISSESGKDVAQMTGDSLPHIKGSKW